MPRPRADSYSRIAAALPPAAAPTMTASAVDTNRALPRPQPARKPTSSWTEPEVPASPAKTTTRARPSSRVFLPPMRLETKPVTSIAIAVIRKYEVNRRETWLAVASRPCAIDGRIGSTSPMPMKATTEAPAVAHTAFGWRRMPPAPASKGSMVFPPLLTEIVGICT
jgi:hypothetical protein